MPERVNGGVFTDQMLTGQLRHFLIQEADFSGAVDENHKAVTGSAAEEVYREVSKKSTVVIMNPDCDSISMALENSSADWTAEEMQDTLRSLGTTGVDGVDLSSVTVCEVPYDFNNECGSGSNDFLGLNDTPDSYAGFGGYHVVVNSTEDGLEFEFSAGTGGVSSVFGRTGHVVAQEGDYTINLLGDVDTLTITPVVDDILVWDGTNWVPKDVTFVDAVTTVFGRTGDITAEVGDYSAFYTQPGDNVSLFTNDAGYITAADVPGDLVTSVFGRTGDVTAQVGDYSAFYTQPGDNVSLFVNDAGYITDITNENLGDLLDVVITTPIDGQSLRYDSGTGNWVNGAIPGGVSTVFGRTGNVVAIEGDYVIDQMGDVDTSTITPIPDDILVWNGTNWVPQAFSNLDAVTSVFGRTGDITAEVGDYSAFYTQPGDNVSVFVNDANYTSVGDNISVFVNDVGYITSAGAPVQSVHGRTGDVTAVVGDYAAFYTQPGDNVSIFTNDANYTSIGDNVSLFVNDAGYITNITNESLGDLSDVTITAVADRDALVYDSGTGDWINEAVVNSVYGRTGNVTAQVSDYSAFYTQPGDNVSIFTNDANYTSIGDNVSVFVNDAGYITLADVPDDLVTSVFGRTGDVVAQEGDYDIDQLGDVDTSTIAPVVDDILQWDGSNWVPVAHTTVNTVDSVFGRTGDVTAEVGDYSAFYTQPGDNVSLFVNDAGYLAAGANISLLNNNVGYITSAGAPVQSVHGRTGNVIAAVGDYTIDQLGDVDVSTIIPNVNDFLQWDGSFWVPVSSAGMNLVTSVHGRIGDVVAVEGDYDIDQLGDVDTSTVSPGVDDVLSWDGSNWVPVTVNYVNTVDSVHGRTGDVVAAEGDYNIGQMSDVDTTTTAPVVGDLLQWDGSNWVPVDTISGGAY